MITEQQYETLRPHIGAIKLTAQSKSAPSTSPWEAMQNVNVQLGRPPVDGWCPNCALTLYEEMDRLINEYEAKLNLDASRENKN